MGNQIILERKIVMEDRIEILKGISCILSIFGFSDENTTYEYCNECMLLLKKELDETIDYLEKNLK